MLIKKIILTAILILVLAVVSIVIWGYCSYSQFFTMKEADYEAYAKSIRNEIATEPSREETTTSKKDDLQGAAEQVPSTPGQDKPAINCPETLDAGNQEDKKPSDTQPKMEQPKKKLSESIPSVPLPVKVENVEEKAKAITGKEPEAQDAVVAGSIVLKKLSSSEIKFLFDAAKDDLFINTSVEELESIRKIIFSKLNEGELAALRAIGQKYGKEMKILDPKINVAEEKTRREKLREKSKK